jgi:hypothetical protein
MFPSWVTLATDTTMLTMEAQFVICARLSQMALSRGSPAENLLIVTEKVNAFAEAAATIAAGGTAHHVVKNYRQKVRANVQRLGCKTTGTGFVRVAAYVLAALASSLRYPLNT